MVYFHSYFNKIITAMVTVVVAHFKFRLLIYNCLLEAETNLKYRYLLVVRSIRSDIESGYLWSVRQLLILYWATTLGVL